MTPEPTRQPPIEAPHTSPGGGSPLDRDLPQMNDGGDATGPAQPQWPGPYGRDNLGELDTFDDLPRPAAQHPDDRPAEALANPVAGVRPVTHRVRYTCTGKSGQHRAADVETRDVPGGLEAVPGGLPPGAYILSVEDLAAGRAVHWTRWPAAYRPGFGG